MSPQKCLEFWPSKTSVYIRFSFPILLSVHVVIGYAIFRGSNSQKDRFRTDPGSEEFQGEPNTCKYKFTVAFTCRHGGIRYKLCCKHYLQQIICKSCATSQQQPLLLHPNKIFLIFVC